jgi:AcrR family transcriptional regulator
MARKISAPRRRRAGPLDRDAVLAAALAVVDRDGLGALSMRTLGARLGVEAMSLYKHVPSKGAILEGLVAAALAEVDWTQGRGLGWRCRVERLALALRDVGRRHPDVFRLLTEAPPLGAAHLAPMEALLETLVDAGFARATAVSVMWTIVSYVLGAVTSELAQTTASEHRAPSGTTAAGLAAFPQVQAAAELLAACDFEAEYLAGLRRVLDGAAGELGAPPPRRVARRRPLRA